MPILPSERKDFQGLITRLGFDETDFQIVVVSEDRVPAGAVRYPEQGTVTIRCLQTQVERTYRTGTGTNWVAEFAQDLEQHKFHKS
jgi:hypothetical protein